MDKLNDFNKLNLKNDKDLILIKQFEEIILNNCKIKKMIINQYIIKNDIILLKIKNEENNIYHIKIIYKNNKIKNISYKSPMLDSDILLNY
jgi:hypothetical protein